LIKGGDVPITDVPLAVADWKARIRDIELYGDYYKGIHRLGQYATPAFIRDYRWVLENSRENLCKAVVRGFSSKLVIQGWESNSDGAAQIAGQVADDLKLEKVFNLAHREAYRTGDAYVLVWPDANGINKPWPKLSRQCAVKTVPGDPDTLQWFALLWIDDAGFGRINLYYDDAVERYTTKSKIRQRSDSKIVKALSWPDKASAYDLFQGDGDGPVITHDFGRVPAVWFPHDADELGEHGRSILQDVVPLQDALNKSVADLIVGGENFAQPLRYLMNYRAKKKIDPDSGEVTEEKIQADPTVNKILSIPGDGPFGQLDPPDATKLLAVHQAYAQKIGNVVGLPAFYIVTMTGEPPTGVALRVMSTRLTNEAHETQTDFGPGWSEVMDLLGVPEVRPIWKDPAPVDESEQLDDAVLRGQIGYPFREVLKHLGEDEEDIDRIMTEKAAQAPSPGQIPNGGALAARAFEAGVDPAELVG
jgi:hypothetical protein